MPQNDLIIEVIKAVAEADGIEPAELDCNLSDHMDPDVLENLGSMKDGTWELTFRVADHQVRVTHEGQIFINGRNYPPDAPRHD